MIGRGKLNILLEADNYGCTVTVNGVERGFERTLSNTGIEDTDCKEWSEFNLPDEVVQLLENQFIGSLLLDVIEAAESVEFDVNKLDLKIIPTKSITAYIDSIPVNANTKWTLSLFIASGKKKFTKKAFHEETGINPRSVRTHFRALEKVGVLSKMGHRQVYYFISDLKLKKLTEELK